MSKTRLILHSNSPWSPTGYGVQTALFAPALAEHYDLQISAFYGLEGAPLEWHGIKVLPVDTPGYGQGALRQHALQFFEGDMHGGLVMTLCDVWVLSPQVLGQFDLVCWLPVDHEPVPPLVYQFLQRTQAVPLGMTRGACRELAEFDALYVPHAVDTTVFRPLGRELARQKLGIDPNAFVVGQVGANKGFPSRKSFVAVLEAFAELRHRHDNALLYLHTDIEGQMQGGVQLLPVMDALGLPDNSVRYANEYRLRFDPPSPAAMAVLYNAMDVLCNPSTGGGFEIPCVEAQACGIPVVATDFTSMREVVGEGWRVGGQRNWTYQQSWQVLPDPAQIHKALEQCYRMSPQRRAKMARLARRFASQYDVSTVVEEHMLPALQAAEDRLRRRSSLVSLKRAA